MRIRSAATISLIALGLGVAWSGVATAEQMVVDVPQKVIFGGPPGAVFGLTTAPVPEEHRGLLCTGELVAQNNHSVHPGNDLRIRSGSSEALVVDVEGVANKTTPLTTPITLGDTIAVDLIMGPDEIFSGAFRLALQCELPEQEPPVEPETPTPTPTPTPPTPQPEEPVASDGGTTTPAAGTTPATRTPVATGAAAVGPDVARQFAPTSTPASRQLPATGAVHDAALAALAAALVATGVGLRRIARAPRPS